MVWKMYLLSNTAILGIYVRFPGGNHHDIQNMWTNRWTPKGRFIRFLMWFCSNVGNNLTTHWFEKKISANFSKRKRATCFQKRATCTMHILWNMEVSDFWSDWDDVPTPHMELFGGWVDESCQWGCLDDELHRWFHLEVLFWCLHRRKL